MAVIGEAGPEIVMPLEHYETRVQTLHPGFGDNPQQIIQIDVGGMHFYGDIADEKFIDKAAEATADRMSEKLYQRFGGG